MKNFIRKILNQYGYDIVKVPPTSLSKKDVAVKVGRFQVTMPHFNPLIKTYANQPEFATEISRLVSYVNTKYPGFTFLDIGANTGDTIARVKSVSDNPVISIEGDDTSFRYLSENVKQFKGVSIIKQFLGEKDETTLINMEKSGWNTTLIPSEQGGVAVSIKKIDTVLNTIPADQPPIKILKIDTEGFDTIILRGAVELLKKSKPVIFLEYNRDNMNAIREDGLSTIYSLEKLGYRRILFYDDIGRFMVGTTLQNKESINNLHSYINTKKGLVYYYNLCLFHESDDDLAQLTSLSENEFQTATGLKNN